MIKLAMTHAKFDSEKDKARTWLPNFDSTMNAIEASDEQRLVLLPLALTGKAGQWHSKQIEKDVLSQHTWTTYKAYFAKHFDPLPTIAEAMASINSCDIRPHESIQQHHLRFQQVLDDCKDGDVGTDYSLLVTYIRMMRPATRDYLTLFLNIKSSEEQRALQWSDLMQQARVYEAQAIALQGTSHHSTSSSSSSSNKPRQTASHAVPVSDHSSQSSSQSASSNSTATSTSSDNSAPPRNPNYKGNNYDPNYQNRFRPASGSSFSKQTEQPSDRPNNSNKNNDRRAPKTPEDRPCWNCHEIGHFANKCPNPPAKRAKTAEEAKQA